jgi:hypothetical protein
MYKLGCIRESAKRFTEQRKEYDMGGYIQVFIKDKPGNDIDIAAVIDRVYTLIPPHLLTEIDSIYIGLFDMFSDMDTNAKYSNGAIYVTSEQDDKQDIVDDIIHEIGHSLEEPYGYGIYGDGKLEREFLQKRKKLYDVLEAEGLQPPLNLFEDPIYNKVMDTYLYKVVGYDRLNFIAASYGLFASAYCATSLREYFSCGFEHYFLDDRAHLQKICPILYEKIKEIHEDDQYY